MILNLKKEQLISQKTMRDKKKGENETIHVK